ncbi:MAG: hypothetical protein ABSG41_17095 [Bryobacteraceae bacterium]|jgi:hypothetical protein
MRSAAVIFAFASIALAQPPVDNVLERMVPPGSTSLVGARMDQIRQTDFYRKLVAAQTLPQVDQFARDTGFDPRRDVRELLFVETPRGSVMLARGTFHLNSAGLKGITKTRHGEYDIWGRAAGGFCILDSTLAVAGDVPAIEAALDEWKSGAHAGGHSDAQPLLARAVAVSPQAQFWGVSTGFAGFLADHPPAASSGLDLSKIFRGLEDTSFQADLSTGLRAEVHGTTMTEKDAASLRDAVRGMVGLGRLQVPENQPELLRVWDGITADQQGRSITIRADIAQNLFDKLIQMLSSGPSGPRHVI